MASCTNILLGPLGGGRSRALAHSGNGRLAGLPELPAVADTLPGFEAYEWNGVFAPAGTPDAVVTRLNAALNAVIAEHAIQDRLAGLAVEATANTPDAFGAYVRAETTKWGRVVREANIRIE